MTRGRPYRAAAAVGASVLAASARLAAQIAGTVDLGMSSVHYDGFLPSSAASLSPALRYQRPWLLLLASGTYLRFESGHHSLQGNFTGSAFTGRTAGGLRGELLTNIGGSTYADFASFSHAIIGPRIHLAGDDAGAWLGGTVGTTSYGGEARRVTTAALGAWTERFAATWLVSGTYNHVGDTTYTDIEGALHAQRWRATLDGVLGVRAWSHGGGHGVYGEASAALALNSHLAVVVSGGRYPTDPIRGSISGRYLGVAFRLTALPWSTAPAPRAVPASSPPRIAPPHSGADGGEGDPPLPPPALSVEIRPCSCDGRTLAVRTALPATSVEVSGDFTDWEPVALTAGAPGQGEWLVTLPLKAGTYRFNVRVDGGEWTVPAGVTAMTDEFGGRVGLLTVP